MVALEGAVQRRNQEVRSNPADMEKQWKKLAGRDLQLWSIGFLVMLVMLSGVLSQFAPVFVEGQTIFRLEYRYLPPLCLGLVSLVLLLNFYLIGQRRSLDLVRYDLIREMALNQSLQQVAMIDPETQFFSRAAISKVLAVEISSCNRYGTALTFAIFAPGNFQKVRLKESPFTADRMMVELAEILRKTFRGSDTLFRYSKSEFLLVMPKTSKADAAPALIRLVENLDHWNLTSDSNFELSLDFGMESYKAGEPMDIALQAAEHNKKSLLSYKSQTEDAVVRDKDIEKRLPAKVETLA
jgi:diguanylate cyclase (GGDEF)-like protein